MSRSGRGRSQIRTVHHEIEMARSDEPSIDEGAIEKRLERAVRDGVVPKGQYDTGRGRLVWFNGWPGEELRRLRKDVDQLVAQAKQSAGHRTI